ncbi:site-specific integrase [Brevibacillus formosus]|uniref:site-specific integrase n=1 Tax=Brevibacillus formosus TaxID=54913 RepID=UPI003F1DB00F
MIRDNHNHTLYHTLKAYSLQLKVLTREIGNLNIGEVTLDLLKEYLAKQSERLEPSSLFRFAFEEGHIVKNPTAKLREPKLEKRISTRARTFGVFYCTGCRVGEVHRLDIEDINWESRSAIVHGKGSKQRELYFTTKIRSSSLSSYVCLSLTR